MRAIRRPSQEKTNSFVPRDIVQIGGRGGYQFPKKLGSVVFSCIYNTAVFSHKFLINDFATSFKVKIQFDHFRSQNNSAKLALK